MFCMILCGTDFYLLLGDGVVLVLDRVPEVVLEADEDAGDVAVARLHDVLEPDVHAVAHGGRRGHGEADKEEAGILVPVVLQAKDVKDKN